MPRWTLYQSFVPGTSGKGHWRRGVESRSCLGVSRENLILSWNRQLAADPPLPIPSSPPHLHLRFPFFFPPLPASGQTLVSLRQLPQHWALDANRWGRRASVSRSVHKCRAYLNVKLCIHLHVYECVTYRCDRGVSVQAQVCVCTSECWRECACELTDSCTHTHTLP